MGRPLAGAVQLYRPGNCLGIAEGIETAESAALLLGIPVWAALGSERLARIAIPDFVERLIARAQEAQGVDREEALMTAGRKRLRPILMTTFALIAGMMPVAIGVGEGGEFYRPMAVAIIGGTITSTLLTLLVIPSFYDSIEVSRDRMIAKFKARAGRWNALFAFVTTFFEAVLTLLLIRWVYRLLKRALWWALGRGSVTVRGPATTVAGAD